MCEWRLRREWRCQVFYSYLRVEEEKNVTENLVCIIEQRMHRKYIIYNRKKIRENQDNFNKDGITELWKSDIIEYGRAYFFMIKLY